MPSIVIPQNHELVLPAGTTLPKPAIEKLARLESELADANSLTVTTMERLRALEEQTITAQQRLSEAERPQSNASPERIDKLKREIEAFMVQRRALSPILAVRNSRASELTGIFVRLRAWAEKLPSGTWLEAAPEQDIGSKPVTPERIEALRDEIRKLQDERSSVVDAPPASEELKEQIRSTVAELAARGGPDLGAFLKGKGRITPPWLKKEFGVIGAIEMAGQFDVLSLLAWLSPDLLIARLTAEVDANRKTPEAELTAAQRAERLAKIDADILLLDYAEEALIDAARAQGQDVARRPSASSLALLGVVVSKGKVAVELPAAAPPKTIQYRDGYAPMTIQRAAS